MQRKLKIKLISPKMSLRPMDSEFKRRMSPSLSLVILASLTPEPHEVTIADENIKPLSFSDQPDLVGVSVNVDTTYRAIQIAEQYRKRGVAVVFGGIHASASPDELQKHCDSVCVGEAEELWPQLLEDHISDRLQKRYVNSTPTDLAKVPLPKWDLISRKNYLYTNIIVASRGCPHKCDFCYNSCDYVVNKYRTRPIENVIAEIQKMNTRQVMFIDDNLIGDITWMRTFVKTILPMGLTWHGAVSANMVHYPDLIQEMAKAGCRSLFIGFESINPESIRSVNKGQNKIEEYEALIKMLHDNNMMVNASLAFGFDNDTKETFGQTLDWLIRNKVETMTSHILTPYPGTRLYKRLLSENRIIDHDLSIYNTAHVVFQPRHMSPDELKQGYLKMYDDFYSLENIIKRRPDNRKLLMPYFLFNLGYRKYGKITSVIGQMGFMGRIGQLGRRLAYGIE
jgi:radical SAM superfamily enzyme YgiQ (UPF0313 family)